MPHYIDEAAKSAGFGPKGGPKPWFAKGSLWIAEGKPAMKAHVGQLSPSREAVAEFHAAAVGAGGKDNGLPGVRPAYHASYRAAFVLDADGINVEAVTHAGA